MILLKSAASKDIIIAPESIRLQKIPDTTKACLYAQKGRHTYTLTPILEGQIAEDLIDLLFAEINKEIRKTNNAAIDIEEWSEDIIIRLKDQHGL